MEKVFTTDAYKVKKGWPVIVEEQNNLSEANGGVRDTRLDLIGKRVFNKEYGFGYIRAVELFPGTTTEERYIIEITDNIYKPILKSLFPDNKMGFWKREFKILDN